MCGRLRLADLDTTLVQKILHVAKRKRETNSLRDELLNEELFDTLNDARRKLALWRYDYNNVRPHSSLGNKTPAEARRALKPFEGSAHDALAQNETDEYEIKTRKLSL